MDMEYSKINVIMTEVTPRDEQLPGPQTTCPGPTGYHNEQFPQLCKFRPKQ